MKTKKNLDIMIAIALALVVAGLFFLNAKHDVDLYNTRPPENINIYGETVVLNSMTLQQKIAQMLIVYGLNENKEFYQNVGVGGIFLTAMESPSGFVETTKYFQSGAKIPFLFSTDVEGCVNTLANFARFPSFSEIETEDAAHALGESQGVLMKSLGLQINFAPVVDLSDSIWKCRSFPGMPEEISRKASSYIAGLQSTGIIATTKHYPGRTLDVRDPHRLTAAAEITKADILPFRETIRSGVKAVMVSHVIASGEVFSDGKPAVVSRRAIDAIGKFDGLIITDDINMLGLKRYYNNNDEQMYVDLFAAGNDMILDVAASPQEITKIIDTVAAAVNRGDISEGQIDRSVKKILKAKGFEII